MPEFIQFIADNMLLAGLWVGIVGALIYITIMQRISGVEIVSTQQATLLMNREDAVVVDVRKADDYKKGHITNAINIPAADIGKNAPATLDKYKTTPIVVVCYAGQTSMKSGGQLGKLGFERVSSLKGGMGEWTKAGLPVVKK